MKSQASGARNLFDRLALVQFALLAVLVASLVLESSVDGPGPLFFLIGALAVAGLVVTMGLRRAPFVPSRAYRSQADEERRAPEQE